jgi:hypothetical protein
MNRYIVVVTRNGEIVREFVKISFLEHARWQKKNEMDHDKTVVAKIYELVEVE